MPENGLLVLVAFVVSSSFLLLLLVLASGRRSRLQTRLGELSGRAVVAEPETVAGLARRALPHVGAPLMPDDKEKQTLLQTRLVQAGLYGKQAMPIFLGVKMLLMAAPALLGAVAGAAGLVSLRQGLVVGALLSVFGMIGPSFWLDRRKKARQSAFRRALPDALDVLVICLEGGLSLAGALKRVSGELRTAHPLLAKELDIAQREMQMGRTTGEALRGFAQRADLEEVRSLAGVIVQSERYGASLVKALRVHADTLRVKRLQHAEEQAQKTAVKILFPTLLCIFPGIFLVILGPAVIQLIEMFGRLQR